jgi:phenylacetate-CoA ligase
VFPSAVENILREFPEIEEFRIETFEREAMRQLKLVVEPIADRDFAPELRERVSKVVRERIGLRPDVELVAPGTLPRFELKAKRFFKLKSE